MDVEIKTEDDSNDMAKYASDGKPSVGMYFVIYWSSYLSVIFLLFWRSIGSKECDW